MKLCNINEEIPEYFYVFLNFNDTFGAIHWNNFQLTKKIYSGLVNNMCDEKYLKNYINGTQKYLPFVKSEDRPNSPTSFSFNVVNYYALEYNLELYRYANECKYPSRLSAIYAFGDYETCVEVNKKYNWDLRTVKKFKLLKNNELLDGLSRVTKHNMEIISYMRGLDCRLFTLEEQNKIYQQYWEGKGNLTLIKEDKVYNTGEIYEYLIEGILELVEEE